MLAFMLSNCDPYRVRARLERARWAVLRSREWVAHLRALTGQDEVEAIRQRIAELQARLSELQVA